MDKIFRIYVWKVKNVECDTKTTGKAYINRQERIFWMRMDRNEAVNYLKELLKNCNNLSPESVAFDQPADCQGYTVRIKGAILETDKQAVRDTAKKHCLLVQGRKRSSFHL